MVWVGSMRSAVSDGKQQFAKDSVYFYNEEFHTILEQSIGAGYNIDGIMIANINSDTITAHTLSINMEKVNAVEVKVRVASIES